MNQPTRTWIAYGCCTLASAGVILFAQVMGWPPAVASSLEQVTQHVAEMRAELLFEAKAADAIEGSA